jgi:hypothetical protein
MRSAAVRPGDRVVRRVRGGDPAVGGTPLYAWAIVFIVYALVLIYGALYGPDRVAVGDSICDKSIGGVCRFQEDRGGGMERGPGTPYPGRLEAVG